MISARSHSIHPLRPRKISARPMPISSVATTDSAVNRNEIHSEPQKSPSPSTCL